MSLSLQYYPVMPSQGREPAISQPFRPIDNRNHNGVDIMFRRTSDDDGYHGHYGSKNWVTFPGTRIIAPHDGMVTEVGTLNRGAWVKIQDDNDGDYVTVYRHLNPANVVYGQDMFAGTDIGIMGYDPSDPEGLIHLHFEVLYKGQYVDPETFLKGVSYGNPLSTVAKHLCT